MLDAGTHFQGQASTEHEDESSCFCSDLCGSTLLSRQYRQVLCISFPGLSTAVEAVSLDGLFRCICESVHAARRVTKSAESINLVHVLFQTKVGPLNACFDSTENKKKFCYNCGEGGHFGHVSCSCTHRLPNYLRVYRPHCGVFKIYRKPSRMSVRFCGIVW